MSSREPLTLTRRGLLGGVLGTALLAACGDSGDDNEETATPSATTAASGAAKSYRLLPLSPSELGAPSVPAATLSTAKDAVPYAQAIAPYKDFGTTAAAGAFPRTVKHARGESTINAQPKRVVALERGSIDILYEVGLKPVAVVDPGALGFAEYLKPFLAGVPIVGTAAEPNFEAIIGTNPDLILVPSGQDARDQRLSQIAPAVFRAGSGVVWKETFALTIQALGQEEKGAAVVQKYEERIKKLNAALPKPRPTFSVVRVLTNTIRYMLRSNYAGLILTDLGIPRPEAQNVDDFALVNMSLETIGQYANADVIVVAVDDGEVAANFSKQMLASPVWQTLDAVKNNRVMIVENSTWIGGIGYESANLVMDDIAKYFKVSA